MTSSAVNRNSAAPAIRSPVTGHIVSSATAMHMSAADITALFADVTWRKGILGGRFIRPHDAEATLRVLAQLKADAPQPGMHPSSTQLAANARAHNIDAGAMGKLLEKQTSRTEWDLKPSHITAATAALTAREAVHAEALHTLMQHALFRDAVATLTQRGVDALGAWMQAAAARGDESVGPVDIDMEFTSWDTGDKMFSTMLRGDADVPDDAVDVLRTEVTAAVQRALQEQGIRRIVTAKGLAFALDKNPAAGTLGARCTEAAAQAQAERRHAIDALVARAVSEAVPAGAKAVLAEIRTHESSARSFPNFSFVIDLPVLFYESLPEGQKIGVQLLALDPSGEATRQAQQRFYAGVANEVRLHTAHGGAPYNVALLTDFAPSPRVGKDKIQPTTVLRIPLNAAHFPPA